MQLHRRGLHTLYGKVDVSRGKSLLLINIFHRRGSMERSMDEIDR